MDATRNLHSQVVGWLKILLPLAALALLSILFLFARQSGEPTAIPLADVTDMARSQGLTAPRISGVTDNGAMIEISAEKVLPDDAGGVTITAPRLSLRTPDASTLSIRATEASLDRQSRTARLSGLARLDTSTGYSMETRGLIANLDTGEVTSLGPLEVQAPFGTLAAGSVRIHITETGEGQQMDFNKGVKLLYRPQPAAEEE